MSKYKLLIEDVSVEAVFNKLGGVKGARRFLRDELVVKEAHPPVFPIWKTLTLGTGPKNADGFRRELKSGGFRIGDWGNDILGKPAFTVSSEETTVALVAPTVSELGFKEGATRENIYKRAHELGLSLCPAEVGPQLRLTYKDQPQGEWLVIGMEPITDSDGFPDVFIVGAGGGRLWLSGGDGDADDFWDGIYRFVFVRRK